MAEWMPLVWKQIVDTAGEKNVTEWAKKQECWEAVQLLDVQISRELERSWQRGIRSRMSERSQQETHKTFRAKKENGLHG